MTSDYKANLKFVYNYLPFDKDRGEVFMLDLYGRDRDTIFRWKDDQLYSYTYGIISLETNHSQFVKEIVDIIVRIAPRLKAIENMYVAKAN